MKKIKVSVLVPICNVEKYLPECLESLKAQTLPEIEFICINDGSTDSSLKILKSFAKDDPRFVIIDKKNSGYGDSMNKGIEKSQGEYIGIVESDDYIEPQAFERMYKYAHDNKADVVRANYFHHTEQKDEKFCYINVDDAFKVLKPIETEWIFYQAPAIWSAIYRKEFLNENKIRFLPTPGASYQDTGFNFKVWATAKKVFFTTESFLHYRLDNSSSSVNNPGKVFYPCEEYAEIEKYLRKRDLYKQLGQIMQTAKAGAYYWNIYRLAPELLPEFLDRVRKEYKETFAEGVNINEAYRAAPQGQLILKIIDEPNEKILRAVARGRIKMNLKDGLKKVYLKTHPNYRKQQAIDKLLVELQSQNRLLEYQLAKERQKRGKK